MFAADEVDDEDEDWSVFKAVTVNIDILIVVAESAICAVEEL